MVITEALNIKLILSTTGASTHFIMATNADEGCDKFFHMRLNPSDGCLWLLGLEFSSAYGPNRSGARILSYWLFKPDLSTLAQKEGIEMSHLATFKLLL